MISARICESEDIARLGFTLIEVLVVVAIIALLVDRSHRSVPDDGSRSA